MTRLNSQPTYDHADGPVAQAKFANPERLACDAQGNILVVEKNHTIRKITPAGIVTTLAGATGQAGNIDGTGGNARFNNPTGITVDSAGNAYVADTSNLAIRKITPLGVVSTLPSTTGFAADNRPLDLAFDSTGNLYVVCTNELRKITPLGVESTLQSRPGLRGIAVDSADNVYVTANHGVAKVAPGGALTVIAGLDLPGYNYDGSADGTGSAAQFFKPTGLAADASGNLYVSDTRSCIIRRIIVNGSVGTVTTIGGTAYQVGWTDNAGAAARFTFPKGIAVDSAGNLYIADTENNTIRKGSLPGPEPAVSQQPQSQTAYTRDTVTLTAVVTGTPTPSLQWRKDGIDLPGATSASFTLTGLQTSDAGSYTLFATNSIGSVISSPSILTVVIAEYPQGFNGPGYLARNADLQTAFGTDRNAAWNHYWNWGLNEGRTFDANFIVDEYLELNPDLKAVFGTDRQAAVLHGFNYGRPIEDRFGRVPIGFNVDSYLARYPDLQAAFGADVEAAALHWFRYGRREGRRIPVNFDVAGYRYRNSDVAIWWGEDLYGCWLHYRDYGAAEGRNFDDLLRVNEYLALNPDVAAAYGSDLAGAALHWIYYGKAEGRPGRY